jgi:hypothetical protein
MVPGVEWLPLEESSDQAFKYTIDLLLYLTSNRMGIAGKRRSSSILEAELNSSLNGQTAPGNISPAPELRIGVV